MASAATSTPDCRKAVQQATALAAQHQYQAAAELLEGARTEAQRDDSAFSEAVLLNNLGLVYEKNSKFSEAEYAYGRSISILNRVEGENGFDLIEPLGNLASLLYEAGQFSRSETLLVRDLAITKSQAKSDAAFGLRLALLGKVYIGEGKYELAREAAGDSLKIFDSTGDHDGLGAGFAHAILGVVYNQNGDYAEAGKSMRRTLEILQNVLDPQDYRVGEAIANLGMLSVSQRAFADAEPLLKSAHEIFQNNALNSMFVRQFVLCYADVERKMGHKQKAKELDREAQTLMASSPAASISRYIVDAHSY